MSEPRPDPRITVDAASLFQTARAGRELRLRSPHPVGSRLNGRHGSRLRGRGLDFLELRTYLPGDDIRAMDWKVTARTGTPHLRVYAEESERPVLLLVDQRRTMFFGSQVYMKSVIAAQAAALLAQATLAGADRMGGIIFSDNLISEHRPQRCPAALRRFLGALARANSALAQPHPQSRAPVTMLGDVLRAAARIAPPSALVIVISDFDGLADVDEAPIRRLSGRGSLMVLPVRDALGAAPLPAGGQVTIGDGAAQAVLDLDHAPTRTQVEAMLTTRRQMLTDWARRHRAVELPLDTARPAIAQLRTHLGLRA